MPGAPRIAVAAASAAALAAALPASASAFDLSVTNVEVTQGIQTPTNSILLVSKRSTAVRVTVNVSLAPDERLPGKVSGRLHLSLGKRRLTPLLGLPPISSVRSPTSTPDRNDETHTLNFELRAPTPLPPTTGLDVRVRVTPLRGETSTANNTGRVDDLRVEDRRTPKIFYVRVNYPPNGRGFPDESLIRRGVGDMFLRGILPVNDGDSQLYRPLPLAPDVTFRTDSDGDGQLNGSDGNQLLAQFATLRQLLVLTGTFGLPRVPRDSYVYGWLAGTVPGNGLGQVGGRTGYGNTDPVRHQASFAHEFTHNLGYNHINETLGQTGWDVGARLLGNPAGNQVEGRVMPFNMNDVQVAGLTTTERWVSEAKYTSLLGDAALQAFRAPAGDVRSFAPRPSRRVAVIHGIFDETGTRLVELRPVLRFPWLSEPTPTDPKGPFRAELRTTSGRTIEVPFNAVVGDDAEPGQHMRQGFFEVMVPVTGELSRLRIQSRDGLRTFGQLTRSEPPRARIRTFERGDVLRGRELARWTVRDPDTPTSQLRYQVAFSGDGGRSFVPVAANLTKPSVRFDTRDAKARRGRGIFRVFVSDGLNTTFTDVRGLTLAK